jgi:hypothetical protein
VGTSTPISITSSITPIEAVNNDLNLVNLQSREGNVTIGAITSNTSGDVKVYPNPTTGDVTLTYDLGNSNEGVLQLYDVVGRLVGSYGLDGSKNTYQFNVSFLCCGVFEYKVMDDQTVKGQGKIIILDK